MIFVTGHTFVFKHQNQQPVVLSGGSIQNQIANRQFGKPREVASPFDARFISGHTYKVSLIKKIVEQDITKVKYLFTNLTNESLPDIDIILASTSAGDEYIAALSGASRQLQEERSAIAKAAENNTDF